MLQGPDFSSDRLVAGVLKGAAQAEARQPRRLPLWDLSVVLEFLRQNPFEPLSSASLENLTLKTVFLVMLASGRRASEVCAFSGAEADVAFEADGSMSLSFLPEFQAKNQRPGDRSPFVIIRSLVDLVSPEEPDFLNCPVRSLRYYRRRTRRLRSKGQRKLFISLNLDYAKDISARTISRWASSLIAKAYKWLDEKGGGGGGQCVGPCVSTRAHEERAWAMSLAAKYAFSMRDVLDAAYWRSEDVFISHYLRDVAKSREDGTFGMPAVMAAGVFTLSSR
jgi:hypothetical protein